MAHRTDDISQIDRLLQVLAVVERSGDKDLAEWLSVGLNQFFDGVPLEVALDLHSRGAGHEKPLTVWRRYQRDKGIRELYGRIEGKNRLDRVEQLKKILEGGTARNERDQDSELWRAVARVRRAGLHVPSSISRLTDIVDQ